MHAAGDTPQQVATAYEIRLGCLILPYDSSKAAYRRLLKARTLLIMSL